MKFYRLLYISLWCILLACDKEETLPPSSQLPTNDAPRLIFRFSFDSTMERLNNLGQPAVLPAGHAAQSPVFHGMSAHYVEMAPSATTALGEGYILYHAPETNQGGEMAIDFDQSVVVGEGEEFLSVPLNEWQPGTNTWLRVSLAYQSYDLKLRYNGLDLIGRLASFVGYNTYIGQLLIGTQTIAVNDDKKQGFWAFETSALGTNYTQSGQSPAGATTVPNPLFATSPIPAGSCVVTGAFDSPLVITGNETSNIEVTVRLSTNKSFEWVDANNNGVFEPALGENVVDMGLRGMKPEVQ